MSTHIFGIRHHGPGCARACARRWRRSKPDIVLVEGPPDAQEVLPLLRHEAMKPPVALLIYAPDAPANAVYYPFAALLAGVAGARYALDARNSRALHGSAAGDPAGARAGGSSSTPRKRPRSQWAATRR